MNMENQYYEDKQDTLEIDEAITLFISMLRLKYTVSYQRDIGNGCIIVYLEKIVTPKIKIRSDIACRHVYYEHYNYIGVGTRYKLDDELFYYFTPKDLTDLIEQDFEAVVAKEGE